MRRKRRKGGFWNIPLWCMPILIALYAAIVSSPSFALRFDSLVGAHLRSFLSRVAALVPFSVTEWLLCALPILLLLLFCIAVLAARSATATQRVASLILLPAILVAGIYVLSFAAGRYTPPLEARLDLPAEAPITASEVLSTASWLSGLAADLPSPPGDSVTQAELRQAYSRAGERYGFCANTAAAVKLTTTPLLLRLGYFGLYAFPLGEITLAAECPDTIRTFTLAHEMAHASGFAREEEADLVALLAALSSGDQYLRASVAEGILGRFLGCLAIDAPDVWREVSAGLSEGARRDLTRAGDILEEGTTAPTIAAVTPDYGRTVRLTVALYRLISAQGSMGESIL